MNQPRRRIRKLLKVSYLAKVFYATMNLSEDAAYPFVQAADLDNRTSEHASQAVTKRVMETDPIGFKRNLDLLIKLVKLEGAKVYVVMEPVLSEEMIRKHVAETNADDWLTGLEHPWHLSLQKHYEIMKNIARENHVPYLWINSADFKYEWFADSHHLKEPGEEAKARVIMDGLTDSRVVSLMKNGGEGDRTLYP